MTTTPRCCRSRTCHSTSSLRSRLLVAGLSLFASSSPALALMAGSATGTPPDSPALRIDSAESASPYAGVGSLQVNGAAFNGTVIDGRYVITAAHVVAGAAAQNVSFRLDTGDGPQTYGVASIHVHPDFVGFNNPNINDDLAIVELSTPVAAGVPIYGIERDPIAAGTTLVLVSYGASGYGDQGVSVSGSASVRRVGENSADAFLGDDEGIKPLGQFEVYAFDFDGPDASSNVLGGPGLGNGQETTLAPGDSGSAAFVRDARGHLLLAGVNTFTALVQAGQTPSTFGTLGGGMLLSGYSAWIDSVITPVPEPRAWSQLAAGLLLIGALGRRRRDLI